MFDLDTNKAMLLVIDIQERLSASMREDEFAKFFKKTQVLINGCNVLEVPIMQSLQYIKGLGNSLDGLFSSEIKKIDFEKRVFSCCYENSPLLSYLDSNKNIRQIIICGMETHICVLQSARDLILKGYEVIIASDSVISRDSENKQNALCAMRHLGVSTLNVESILFDLLKSSESSHFKAISALVK